MQSLVESIGSVVGRRRLLRCGERVLVAVSGGVDSMVLLHVLHALSGEQGWRLVVAHFNHQLRGRAAAADEALVGRVAARLGCAFVAGRGDVRALADKKKISVEMAARKLRHEFLARVARARKIRSIALAHHADDQVELFFLRLLRGAGSDGLAGMKWRAISPVDKKIFLIRPLLGEPRAAIEALAAAEEIPFRTDTSNGALDIPRNRLRQELLPLLRKNYQPALTPTVLRLMEILGAEGELAAAQAGAWLASRRLPGNLLPERARPRAQQREAAGGFGKIPPAELPAWLRPRRARSGTDGTDLHTDFQTGSKRREEFSKLPVAVQRRVVQRQLQARGVEVDFERVEALRRTADQPVTVAPGLHARRDGQGRVVIRKQTTVSFRDEERVLDLRGGSGAVDFGGLHLEWERRAGKNLPVRGAGEEWFDAAKVGPKIIVRHWRAGDRFQPIGLPRAVKLQDWFTNRKVLRARRHELTVATTAAGEIFWVEDQRIGERFKLDNTTVCRLKWHWRRLCTCAVAAGLTA